MNNLNPKDYDRAQCCFPNSARRYTYIVPKIWHLVAGDLLLVPARGEWTVVQVQAIEEGADGLREGITYYMAQQILPKLDLEALTFKKGGH